MAGELESSKFRDDDNEPDLSTLEDEHLLYYPSTTKKEPNPDWNDALGDELGVNVLDCRKPFIPFEEFYNEPLSDAIEMDNDYLYYKNRQGGTSIAFHVPFLLPQKPTINNNTLNSFHYLQIRNSRLCCTRSS